MFDLSAGIDGLDNSILMAEAIMKKKANKKKLAKDSVTKKQRSGSRAKSSTCSSKSRKSKSGSATKSTQSGRTKTSKSTSVSVASKYHNKTVVIPAECASVVSEVSSVSSFQGEERSAKSFAMSSDIPAFRHSMLVDRSWENVKAIDGYEEEFGEQILLHMMEMDPSVRKDLGIKSLRSMRFDEVCHTIAVIVDLIVSLCGPDLDEFEDELTKIGKQCSREGIKVELLGSSVGVAVKGLLPDLPDEDVHAWKVVIDYVVQKMIQAPQ